MQNDFLKELKFLGVTARLKRLNDVLSANIKELYNENNLDIEPSWHLVFLILKKRKSLTMSDMAAELNLSQPALTKMTTRMVKKGYLEISADESDKRKKILTLTEKALSELPKFEKVWNAGQKSIRDILKGNVEFFESLDKFELQIVKKSFKERAVKYL